MIKECLEIFKEKLDTLGEAYILDNYVPKDGTYYLVEIGEKEWKVSEAVNIFYDKKQDCQEGRDSQYYSLICYMDYYSKLITMNKPVDQTKIIHSNNYLSVAVKKESLTEGKLTDQVLDGYYDILKNPRLKYKKANVLALYEETERDCGEPDAELLVQIQAWVKENIYSMELGNRKKDYLKLFFLFPDETKTRQQYKQEGNRYIIPNIYNNNDYNISIDGKIYGLPSDNLGMNSKKPYLANRSRKIEIPYMLEKEEVLLQAQFYDYLMGLVSKRRTLVYIDCIRHEILAYKAGEGSGHSVSGYFLQMQKGKNEVEIHNADTIVGYNPNLKPVFYYKNVLEVHDVEGYGLVNKKWELERLIDDVFFGKSLIYNYFTKPDDMTLKDGTIINNLMMARDILFAWFYKNDGIHVWPILNQISMNLVHHSIESGYWKKAQHQLNLRWSLMDYFKIRHPDKEDTMGEIMYDVKKELSEHLDLKEEWGFSSEQEYYFAVGQLVSFFISKSNAMKKPLSFVNPFLNARKDSIIKKHLEVLFKKYNYAIFYQDSRVKNLYSHVMLYQPQGKIDTEMISAGVTASNLIFKKKGEI